MGGVRGRRVSALVLTAVGVVGRLRARVARPHVLWNGAVLDVDQPGVQHLTVNLHQRNF